MKNIKKILKPIVVLITLIVTSIISMQGTYATTLEEQMNNLIGPKQQYNTMLSPAYLRNNVSEESISPQSGDITLSQTDYVLPGINGLDLEIKRMYRSGTSNVQNMKAEYQNGVWVDQVYSDNNTSSFYEDRYDLGVGMRFSFPAIEAKSNSDGSSYKFLHTEAGDVYRLTGPKKVDGVNTYEPENQTIKDVTVKENKDFSNGQTDGTSFYVMENKTGKKTYFAEDGRVLGIVDRYGNKITFEYKTQTYTIDGIAKTKKLISKIIDTMGREVTLEYNEDQNFTVGAIENNKYSLEDSWKESQNPDTVNSGDLKGKFQVIVNLPGGEKIIYDKSAVLVSSSKHVVRTRLQRVYDVDGKPKYHYWYDQPSLGFTYTNGTVYKAYNRYENLTQIDYCRANRVERFTYNTYIKGLADSGSMEYRKIFEKKELAKTGYDNTQSNFLDRFQFDVKDRIEYKYTNEADGYGFSGYKANDDAYLKDTYKYFSEKKLSNGTVIKYTYNGIHEQVNSEETGTEHKIVSTTEFDEMKFPKKIESITTGFENGKIKGQPVKKTENYRYDMYGNLTNYTGPIANRDDKGYPADNENTVVYAYAFDKFHILQSKTWKLDKNTTSQVLYTIDAKGNVTREESVHTSDKDLWNVTEYEYDKYGNMTKKTVHSDGNDQVTNYEYGIDIDGVNQKGAYLTKQYGIVNGVEISKRYSYDFNTGNMKAELDGKGNRISYEYDTLSRLQKITYPDNTIKQYTYNDFKLQNRQIEYIDQSGEKFRYTYDIFGNQLNHSVYDKEAWHTLLADEYDALGNKIKETDSNGNSVRFTYNSENSLVKKDYYEKDSAKKESLTLDYTYGADADTKLLMLLTDEDGYTKRLHYDITGKLVKSEQTPDKTSYYSASYAYDYVGNVVSQTDAKGNTTKYSYDDLGRVVSKTDALNNETRYTYTSFSQVETIEEPGGRTTKYIYDSIGRIVEERVFDQSAADSYVYKKYTYDENNNVTSISQGKVDKDTDTLAAFMEYAYNSMDRITDEYSKIDSAKKSHIRYSYDNKGNKTGITQYINESGSSAIGFVYEYNFADKVTREEGIMSDVISPVQIGNHGNFIRKFSYDYEGNVLSQELYNGAGFEKITYGYDHRNRLITKIEPFTKEGAVRTTSYSYDKRGNLASETLNRSGVDCTTQYQYNGMGGVAAKIDPMGYVSKYLYDENGSLIKEIDPRFSAQDSTNAPGTVYEYDALNRLKKVSVFDGSESIVISYKEYDGRGNVIKEADGEGYNKDNPTASFGNTYVYDAYNNVLQYTSAQTFKDNKNNGTDNYSRKYTYDASGRVLSETDAYGNRTQNIYFLNGLLKQTIYADNTSENYEYDLTGNTQVIKTDKLNNRTVTFRNLFGKVYRTDNPDNTYETYEYSPKGELASSVDRAGNARYFEYDLSGNLTAEKDYVKSDSTYDYYRLVKSKYDEAGNILSSETFESKTAKASMAGQETSMGDRAVYTYDKNGRTTKVSGPAGQETINEYDKKGNLVTKREKVDTDNYKVTRYIYDVQSRQTTQAVLVDTSDVEHNYLRNADFDNEYTAKVKAKTAYTYYQDGQLKTKTDAYGNTTQFKYDLDKRVKEKINALNKTTSYNYDLNGNLLEERNAAGISTYYEYDSMNRLIRRKAPAAGGGQAVTRYIYDEMGNLKKQIQPNLYEENKDTAGLAETMKGTSYTYDSMNRRTTTVSPEGSTQEYLKYDANGNIVKRVDGLRFNVDIEASAGTSYEYDALGRAIKTTNALQSSKTYEYDILGNLTRATDERGNSTLYKYNADGTLAKAIFADTGSVEYTYDRLGRKISLTDQRGNTTTFSYNSFGSIKTETDCYGNSMEYMADLLGNIVALKDKKGSITYITYDAENRVVSKRIPFEKDSGGSVLYTIENYVYDEIGNVITREITGTKDKLSAKKTTYTYYDNNLVNTVTDSSGAYTRAYYDKNGNRIKIESLRSEGIFDIQKFEYDIQDRIVKEIKLVSEEDIHNAASLPNLDSLKDGEYLGKLMLITAYEYDILGNKTKVISPLAFGCKEDDTQNRANYTTEYSYDLLNRLEMTTRKYDGRNVLTQYTYDAAGNMLTVKNERGYTTVYTYDGLNRVETITDAKNNQYRYAYDLSGNKSSETNAKGYTMTYDYDKLNRLQTVTDAYNKVISRKVYDANGNIIKEIDAEGYQSAGDDESRYGTIYTYNLANMIVSYSTPEAEEKNEISIKYTYNQYGEVIKQTDGLGSTISYEYDATGNLTKVTDALGTVTKYSYDKQGNKLTMTDGRGKLTRYAYTAFGNLKSVINADNQTQTYKYDLEGNTVCVTDKNGNNTLYTYDNRGLLLQRKVAETEDSISYAYDETGNRSSMTDESGTSIYYYDENNRLTGIQKGGNTQVNYAYDQTGNVIKVTDLKGNTVEYTYDKSSRLETVNNGGKTTTYSYDDNGRRSSITYAGGVSENYSYDRDNRLITITNMKPNGGRLSEFSYTYDLGGRQITKTDLYGTTDYEYDKAGRIIKVATPGKTTVYSYDKAGNRVSQNETYISLQPSDYIDEATGKEIQYILKKSDYTYSNTNQLLKLVERMFDENNKEIARKTTKYSYDSNGNQLKQGISHSLPNNTGLRPKTTGTAYGDNVANTIDKLVEKTSYTYDGFNRLKKTETVKAGIRTTVDFTYNGDDLRVSKTVKKSDKGYQAEVTNYLYDRQNVILETDASNNIKARYVKGINYIAKADAAGKESYFLYNGHGDVVQTVDAAGTVENQYDYDIWGNPTLTVETTSNAIRYTGEFYDEETGLYYLRARYYDPYLGRFTTEDSYWGEDDNPLSLNLYTYCENDPIQYVDPSGHRMSDNELDFFFGKGASQLFDDNGNYKKGTVAMMVEGVGAIVNVDTSKALDSRKYGYTIMTPDTKVYGNIDNYSNIDVINTADNRYTSITNHEGNYIGTINTGANSYTTVNNYSIIDTINSGKCSSLVVNNYNKDKDPVSDEYVIGINKITGELNSKIKVFNYGGIGEIHTGAYSENEIWNLNDKANDKAYVNWLETGLNNSTYHNGNIVLASGNGRVNEDIKYSIPVKYVFSDGTTYDNIVKITPDSQNSKNFIIVEKNGTKHVITKDMKEQGYKVFEKRTYGEALIHETAPTGKYYDKYIKDYRRKKLDTLINNVEKLEELSLAYYGYVDRNSVIKVIRRKYDGAKWDVTAGPIDEKFIKYIKENNSKLLEFFSDNGSGANLIDPGTGENIDFQHLMASLNAICYNPPPSPGYNYSLFADLASWAGDLQQAIGDLQRYQKKYNISNNLNDLTKAAETIIAGKNSTFSINDMYADIDAYNIGIYLNNNPSKKLSEALNSYYSYDYTARYEYFVSNYGGIKNLQEGADRYTINASGKIKIDILNDNKISKITDNQLKALSAAFMNFIKKEAGY
ncbi:RHS repeat-associated core domain-containing protein [Ruminiclostridium cellobioparum]|uniref:RHS repeat-associated core domain-containing protein n=1 Tax=Ruminiclostridium cellobioparum subsp. termitidis CT1112 TaxID=1195236 RepID=S0FMS5_RUMCE|nr:RHS repeat-associated core domain-containing protein [Ruminiclostridium cellobioparum]EMS70409.1 RHS repeat-associated core domain-containing protein [Ruminiclostridium cellobioparum subsp. termitidis CT1112]